MQPSISSKTFIVWSDELKGILSPAFFTSTARDFENTVSLSEIADINPLRKVAGLSDESIVPYIGLPETSNKKVDVVVQRPYKEVKGRQIVFEGDILFARIEPSIFNKKYIYVDDLQGNDYAFTSTEFIVIRPKENCDPQFLFNLLFNDFVYSQFAGKTTGSTGRRRLEKVVLANIQIPSVSSEVQSKVANLILEQNRALKDIANKLVAETNGIENTLEEVLGLSRLEKEKAEKWFTVWNDSLTGRIDASPYHPDRMNAIGSIESSKFPRLKLDELVDFQKTQIKTLAEERYIGLENVEPNTGQLIDSSQAKLSVSSATKFSEGDILFAKLRPYLNKVHLAKFNGVCSTEFHVLRCNDRVLAEYLRAFLSSELVVRQTSHLMTGNTLPRLQTEEIRSLLVPVPDIPTQEHLVESIKTTEQEITSLEHAAKKLEQDTQKTITELIFG